VHLVDVITGRLVMVTNCICSMEKSGKIPRALNNSRQTEKRERERERDRERKRVRKRERE